MKNAKLTMAQKRFKKPEASMHSVLKQNLLSTRHHYEEVLHDSPLLTKLSRLPPDSFRAKKKHRSMPFQEVVGTAGSATSWPSPCAANLTARYADAALLRDLSKQDAAYDLVEHAWFGELIKVEHSLLVRIEGFHEASVWYYGLGSFDSSAVLAWPGVLTTAPGSTWQFWEPRLDVKEPVMFALCELGDRVLACSVVWRSPMWQRRRVPALLRGGELAC